MQITAKEIAQILGGNIEGNPETIVSRPAKIEEGGKETITFLANAKYENFAYTTPCAIILIQESFTPKKALKAEAIIRVEDVYAAVAKLLQKFDNQRINEKGISKEAYISPKSTIEEEVSIGVFSVIEDGVIIGKNTQIYPQVFIGKNAKIGENVTLYPGVKIHSDCEVGDNCILHSNVVIGGDGFGFAPQNDGSYGKIPQLGNVVLESDVEIGANTTIDRATMGSTIIRKGAKLDNLIMVAHNVEIGQNTVVAAQAGFAGSGKIGENCRIGGQAGFVGHIRVADGTQVQAQSGVARNVKKENTALYGSPALDYSNYLKSYSVFKNLPDIYKKVTQLEKRIKELENS